MTLQTSAPQGNLHWQPLVQPDKLGAGWTQGINEPYPSGFDKPLAPQSHNPMLPMWYPAVFYVWAIAYPPCWRSHTVCTMMSGPTTAPVKGCLPNFPGQDRLLTTFWIFILIRKIHGHFFFVAPIHFSFMYSILSIIKLIHFIYKEYIPS